MYMRHTQRSDHSSRGASERGCSVEECRESARLSVALRQASGTVSVALTSLSVRVAENCGTTVVDVRHIIMIIIRDTPLETCKDAV